MDAARAEAEHGRDEGGIPIGSVLVIDDEIVGRGRNRRVQQGSAILHAEMDCLENAGRLTAAQYRQASMYSTLSPCSMCTGAILLYGIPTVVVGEKRTFAGPQHLLEAAGVEVYDLDDQRCVSMMQRFISEHPALWNEDIGE
jgi:cytosine/creatinine deaminase